MRFPLRTLLILLAVGPPILAVSWWYFRRIPGWVLVMVAIAVLPELVMATFIHGFGALCHWIGRLPGGHDPKEPPWRSEGGST
jgi:hypothetical protein